MSTTPMNTTTSHTNTAADNAQPRDWIEVLPGKTVSKYADPCAHAAKASMKCLETNQVGVIAGLGFQSRACPLYSVGPELTLL